MQLTRARRTLLFVRRPLPFPPVSNTARANPGSRYRRSFSNSVVRAATSPRLVLVRAARTVVCTSVTDTSIATLPMVWPKITSSGHSCFLFVVLPPPQPTLELVVRQPLPPHQHVQRVIRLESIFTSSRPLTHPRPAGQLIACAPSSVSDASMHFFPSTRICVDKACLQLLRDPRATGVAVC